MAKVVAQGRRRSNWNAFIATVVTVPIISILGAGLFGESDSDRTLREIFEQRWADHIKGGSVWGCATLGPKHPVNAEGLCEFHAAKRAAQQAYWNSPEGRQERLLRNMESDISAIKRALD
jgi:hypothetical protein